VETRRASHAATKSQTTIRQSYAAAWPEPQIVGVFVGEWDQEGTVRFHAFALPRTAYDADLRRRKGADADTPHRVTYKKLVRS
jgi:hypothetical protein